MACKEHRVTVLLPGFTALQNFLQELEATLCVKERNFHLESFEAGNPNFRTQMALFDSHTASWTFH